MPRGGEGEDAEADQPDRGGQHQGIDVGQTEPLGERRAAGSDQQVLQRLHQPSSALIACSRMRATTGAAASTPKPPPSTVATTTILGSPAGAIAPYHDWSSTPRLAPRCRSCPRLRTGSLEHRIGGAARLHRRPLHPVEDRLAGLLGDPQPAPRRWADPRERAAVDGLDPGTEMRGHHGAPIGEGGIGRGELQGRHLQVSLADAEVDVVAGRPGAVDVGIASLAEHPVAPGGRGEEAGLLARKVYPGPSSDPVGAGPVLDLAVPAVRARLHPEPVEVDVRGDLERVAHVYRPVDGAPRVLEDDSADGQRPAVGDDLIGPDQPPPRGRRLRRSA